MRLDLLRHTMLAHRAADFIMLAKQIQSGCHVWYWLLLRLLGLMVVVISIGMLELWVFQKVNSLWLDIISIVPNLHRHHH